MASRAWSRCLAQSLYNLCKYIHENIDLEGLGGYTLQVASFRTLHFSEEGPTAPCQAKLRNGE